MGNFIVSYASRVVIYAHRAVMRLATGLLCLVVIDIGTQRTDSSSAKNGGIRKAKMLFGLLLSWLLAYVHFESLKCTKVEIEVIDVKRQSRL